MERSISAGKFKAAYSRIMDEVRDKHCSFVITKHSKPVAKVVPFEEKEPRFFGKMKGSLKIKGDVVASVNEKWNACSQRTSTA